jgi:flagellar basal body-associated protein FliL
MPNKMIIIGAAALPVLGGGGYFAMSMFMAKPAAKVSPAAAAKKLEKKARAAMKLRIKTKAEGETLDLGGDFVVNLDGLAHFAKFDVSMAVDKLTKMAAAAGESASAAPSLEDQAQIRDIIISDTASYSAAQLTEPGGKAKLKKKIIADVTEKTNTLPLNVYFTNFAIQ